MPKYPKPRTDKPLIAPNEQAEVQATIDAHPEIDTMDEEARGEILDITARRLNPGGGEKPWGRKARHNNPSSPNLNTDGMTFLRPDGLFEIYDCISGIDGQSTWDPYGPFAQGENGYWWPPNPVEDEGEGEGGGGEIGELPARVTALEEAVVAMDAELDALTARTNTLDTQVADLTARLQHVEAMLAQGFHAHGLVDLPIILESLTSLRARGDIDVAVQPGTATPPDVSADDGGLDPKKLWLWLRRRDDDEDEQPRRP